MSEDAAASEIIVVRRRGHGHDDGHGSTAWKIAFADFMTAMMALFLVLWLTNATDMATKKQIATYFNPIELTDTKPLEKGIRTSDGNVIVDKVVELAGPEGSSEGASEQPGTLDGGPEKLNRPMFSDPYDVIRKLSEKVGSDGAGLVANVKDSGGGPAIQKGTAYRDPFDPAFRSETLAMAHDEDSGEPKVTGRKTSNSRESAARHDNSGETQEGVNGKLQQRKRGQAEVKPAEDHMAGAAKPASAAEEFELQEREVERQEVVKREAKAIVAELKKEFANAKASELPTVEVSVVPEGILVSLTDNADFEMFASASARPNSRLGEMMQKIGGILKSMVGPIVIRGHTDARPFRTAENDNWQLSVARAYNAYSALIAAGVNEQRFDRIEGYADHKLRDETDPNAAANRRIEVLLRKKVE